MGMPNFGQSQSSLELSSKLEISQSRCAFGMSQFFQPISTFNLFLLLFIGPTVLFDIIHESRYTIQLIF